MNPENNIHSHCNETSTNNADCERVEFTLKEWEDELAKAEQRGYTRGRNEQIMSLNARPEIFENATVEQLEQRLANPDSFLPNPRTSIWDR